MQVKCIINSRNYRLTGTETWQIFSRMFEIAKKLKKLFPSTLNGITASVRCVSSIIVVLNANLTRLIAGYANGKARQECRFVLVKTHKLITFIAVLTVHAKTSL